jgi:nucleoside triphosphatase
MTQKYPEATVGALVVNPNGDVLIVRSSKWNDKYTVPCGHIELGELAEDAIRREVREETGLDVEVVKLAIPYGIFHQQNPIQSAIPTST